MNDVIVFINHVGQTIIAEQVSVNDEKLEVKNPSILHVTPNQTGQLQVQLIPLFFKEFLEDKSGGAVFAFNRANVVTSSVKLDGKIAEQYSRIFNAPSGPVNSNKGPNSEVIKLFDD